MVRLPALKLPQARRPPTELRPPTEEDFSSPLHDERVVARIGVWLGTCLALCFLTGLISHYPQNPTAWLPLGPNRSVPTHRRADDLTVAQARPAGAAAPGRRAAGTTGHTQDLSALAGNHADLPIACVEGWSAQASWGGVRIRDLVRMAGGDARSSVQVESLETHGTYRTTTLPAAWADDPRTLLALTLNGETLHLEHGYPARIISPNRPGVLQTRWIQRLHVSDGNQT